MLSLPALLPNLGGRTGAENTANGLLKGEERKKAGGGGGGAPSVLFRLVLLFWLYTKAALNTKRNCLSVHLFQRSLIAAVT